MRPIVAWLLARPWNGMLGMAMTLVAPFRPVLSGTLLVLLLLARGPQQALVAAAGGLGIAGALLLVFGNAAVLVVWIALLVWVPATLLTLLMLRGRSLALAMQVLVIAAVALTLGFHVMLDDPAVYWLQQIEQLAVLLERDGWPEGAALLNEHKATMAGQMTMAFALYYWLVLAVVLVAGHKLYRLAPGEPQGFGRFRDLQFGRVIALLMAVASVLTLVLDAAWLRDMAFVLFAVFMLQGLAILHWLHSDGPLPLAMLIAVYVLLPFMNVLLVMMLAVLGYTDAWFRYRPGIAARREAD